MKELLAQSLQENASGRGSSKRINATVATVAMSLAIILLAVGGMLGHDVALAITGVSASLAGMCGYNYVQKKES